MINFKEFVAIRNKIDEVVSGPQVPPAQALSTWRDIYTRALPNQKYVIGSFLWNNDNKLYGQVTGQQQPPQYRGNTQPTNV